MGISPAHLARLEMSQRGLYLDDFVRIVEALGEKPGNLLPNDLGDLSRLKPIIDRLAAVRPECLVAVGAIVNDVVQLAEQSVVAPEKKRRRDSRKTAPAAQDVVPIPAEHADQPAGLASAMNRADDDGWPDQDIPKR